MKKKKYSFKKRRTSRIYKKTKSQKRKIYKIFISFILIIIYFIIITKILKINPLSVKNIVYNDLNLNDIRHNIKHNTNIDNSEGRIFLCTLYNNEAETAYIHIWRLYNYVYRFIIVVSNITHSGHPKTITFKDFSKDIKPFMDKVDIVFFDNTCNKEAYPTSPFEWCNEHGQRDYAKTYIEENYQPTEKDLLIVADLDEILTREGIEYIKKHPPSNFTCLKGSMYFPYYYFKIEDWNWAFVVRYNKKMLPLSKYRGRNSSHALTYDYNPSKPLFTHCTYCFKSIEEYKHKLQSFAHKEYSGPPYTTNNWIFRSHYCRSKLNSYPGGKEEPYEGWKHLIPDDKRLKYLMDPSYMYNLSETSYTEKDLEHMCFKKFNRKPFE